MKRRRCSRCRFAGHDRRKCPYTMDHMGQIWWFRMHEEMMKPMRLIKFPTPRNVKSFGVW